MSAEQETQEIPLRRKKRARIIAGTAVAVVLGICAPVSVYALTRGEDNPDRGAAVSAPTGIVETTTEPVPSPSLPSESPSSSPFPSVEASPSVDVNKAPESVLDIVPALGLLTYSGGANIDTPYASGVALGPNHFLTSAALFGPRPEDASTLCGDFRGTKYAYQINTGAQEHDVVNIRRHPDPEVNLAILTVATPFESVVPYGQVADAAASGDVYVANFQDKPDSTHRSPSTGALIFAGNLASPSLDTTRSVDNTYYGPQDWKIAAVANSGDFGYNSQTGEKDTTQEGSAGAVGGGGPLVTSEGTIVGIQTAHDADGQVPGFLATRVTKDSVAAIMQTASQAC